MNCASILSRLRPSPNFFHTPTPAAAVAVFLGLSTPPPPPITKTSDAAFIPAGWDSKRLIDGLLSSDKTPWGPTATFAEVVVPPPGAAARFGDSDSGGDGGGGLVLGGEGGGGGESVQSEEAWLSSLGKQVAGTDGKSRWPSAIAAVTKQTKLAKVGQRQVGDTHVMRRCSCCGCGCYSLRGHTRTYFNNTQHVRARASCCFFGADASAVAWVHRFITRFPLVPAVVFRHLISTKVR